MVLCGCEGGRGPPQHSRLRCAPGGPWPLLHSLQAPPSRQATPAHFHPCAPDHLPQLPACRRYNRELPYVLQPQLLKCYLRRQTNTYRIHQAISVDKSRTRAIVVGPKGQAIQHYVVARAARELERLTGRKVELTVGAAAAGAGAGAGDCAVRWGLRCSLFVWRAGCRGHCAELASVNGLPAAPRLLRSNSCGRAAKECCSAD